MLVKKSLLVALPLLVAANFIYTQTLDERPKTDLVPTGDQSRVSVVIGRILSQYHYQKTSIDDSLSSELLDNYLKNLDYNRMYFLASDVKSFEKYRYQLDNDLKDGNLTPAYEIYQVYKTRAAERNAHITRLLATEMDFTADEYFNVDREKAPWPKDTQEVNDIWRKRVKSEALNLKLSNKKWDEIAKLLGERYKNIDKAVSQSTSEDVFEAYMNSFAET